MRRALSVILLAFAISSCGGYDLAAACKSNVEARCNRWGECATDRWQIPGGSVSTCATVAAQEECTSLENATCPSGYHYDSTEPSRCADEYENLACDRIQRDPPDIPPSCYVWCVQ